jgi:hypothetical protein
MTVHDRSGMFGYFGGIDFSGAREPLANLWTALGEEQDGRLMIKDACKTNGLLFAEFQELVQTEVEQTGKQRRAGLWDAADRPSAWSEPDGGASTTSSGGESADNCEERSETGTYYDEHGNAYDYYYYERYCTYG